MIKFDVTGERTNVWDIPGRKAAEDLFWALALIDDTIALSYVEPPDLCHPAPVLETGKHWRRLNSGEMPLSVVMVDREIERRRNARG